MKIADIARVIEAVLFVSGDGVDRDEFKRIYDLSDKELNKCLDILKEKYTEDSGIHLISYKNKIQLCSNPALADSVAEILNPIRERSLTKAALETVAIVAYKQPITRTEIEQIRGVNSDYAVQLLQSNNLIEVVGRKDAVGKPLLFGTTDNFLKRFELTSLEELPNYRELLDRIRVIHSEGDSLYREFSIPDEDGDEKVDGLTEQSETNVNETYIQNEKVGSDVTELKNETIEPIVEVAEKEVANISSEETIDNTKEKSVEILETDNNIVVATKEVKPKKRKGIIEKFVEMEEQSVQETKTVQEENVEEKPKVSWRDKMRAKMSENSTHYENLQEYVKK
jgi:segregation and condensation protein B